MDLAVVHFVLRVCVGAVLFWASADKAADFASFRRGLGRYRILPSEIVAAAAVLLLVAEFATGLALLIDVYPQAAALSALVLFGTFTAAITIDLLRDIRVPCQCFGSTETELLSWASLVRAGALSGMSLALAGLSGTTAALPPEAVVPALTLALASALVLRLIGLVPQAVGSLRAAAVISPAHRHRTSLKAMPLDGSLRVYAPDDSTVGILQLATRPELLAPKGGTD